ncbi:MAG: ATP-dependent RNA helicase HrpA [Rhodocyclaceae bacterium]|nr:ATP-dependent RNA helicase HrpA [Rhodocyclaceae bacterium]
MSADRAALRRAVPRSAKKMGDLPPELRERLLKSAERRSQRLANRPKPEFPEELPVNVRRQEIAEAIQKHQVIIVCGETGSGKTTQLPKICLELGRGTAGLIGHTQPRRIAARATASRIAQELNSELGRIVGYKIRFTDRSSPESYVKLMTDGILLAETQGDPLLSQYDTLIIDEAHERSLNIDFLLGYLKQLLLRRPDMKVIVTSATLDAERFAKHFDGAPVIEVSGRLFPIELRYRPLDAKDKDLPAAIVEAVDEVQRIGSGDVLVFLPGEREIRESAEALRKHHKPGTEILPLFARQSAQEQSRIFAPGGGRRVVLATNVAETSLTVPGIRYVVDSGLARVKRYSVRNKVEQLQVEPIAQSAAKQRAGRCGRVSSGVCIRLYEEDDYNKRPGHTDPEVLRSSLAGVILRMKSLHLGDVEDFPFIDPPPPRAIADGYQLLSELGAVDDEKALTATGRELAKLPLDPKIGRMILAARGHGCVREMLVIAAALSSQDPRERPQEQSGTADQAHARFRGTESDQRSEFLWHWNLWQAFDAVWQHETSSKQKAWCRSNFLNYLRMREWRDIHGQLHALAAEHGWRESDQPASFEAIHKALLTGLLGNIGLKSEEEPHYLGARGIRFFPHPGSALAKKAGKWMVAAELVETSRLFARCLARIEPEWLEEVGGHMVKRHVFEPHWEKGAGAVVAFERGTLHGIVLYGRRRIQYGPLDAQASREIFLRDALVRGEVPDDWARRTPFFQHNQKLMADIERLEHKTRRPDVLVDEALIHAFYDALVPEGVSDLRAFDAWRKDAEAKAPKLLFLQREQIMRHEAAGVTTEKFPPKLDFHGQSLKLSYHHEPGASDDGVTLTVPLPLLNQISANRCEWLVPGMLEQKVLALVKTVPQKIRHRLMPLAAYAADFCDRQGTEERDMNQPLEKVLARDIEEKVSLKLALETLRSENLAAHFFMNFRVIDEHGRVLGQSRDLSELRSRLGAKVENAFAAAALKVGLNDTLAPREGGEGRGEGPSSAHRPPLTPTLSPQAGRGSKETKSQGAEGGIEGLTAWSFGELPELLEVKVAGRDVIGFPGLVDEGDGVSLRAFDTPEKAAKEHRAGLRRLFALELREQVKFIEKNLPGIRDMAMQYMVLGSEAELKAQLVAATLERSCMMDPWPTDAASFNARRDSAKSRLVLISQEMARIAGTILTEWAGLTKKLVGLKAHPAVVEDIQAQLRALITKDFVTATPFERLQHFPRYLKAATLRIEKLRADPARDARLAAEWQILAKPFEREHLARLKNGVTDPALEEFRWMLEELRVNLFAQELKTPMPVSVKRLQKIWESRGRM